MKLIRLLALVAVSAACAADISVTLGQPGRVSLAVYDREGHLLRSLLYGQQLPAGEQRIPWDGLDARGRALPAGEYEWRLLRNEGLQAEYLLNVGANAGWAPYGMWVGSHGTVSAATLDAQGRLYIGGLTNENCPAFQCISLDGKTLHWQRFQLSSFKGAQRLAARDGRLYVLQQDAWLYALDANDPQKELGKWDVIHPDEPRPAAKPGFLPAGHEPGGLAVHGKFIVVSHPAHSAIRWHERETLKLLREEKVSGARGLTVLDDGTVFAAAGNQVWRIAFPAGKPEPLVRDDTLAAAAHVAADAQRDALWVAEAGTAHTIRRYRLSTGERTLQVGSKEGRPFGTFDPLHWRDIMDITCDGTGGIITVEATPRRVAHFAIEGDRPRLIRQWFGGQQWGNLTATDPADPTITYVNASSFHRARVRMDWAKRTWEMEALYDTPPWASRREGKSRDDAPFPSLTHTDAQWQVMHRGNQSFLVSVGGHSCHRAPAVIRVDTGQQRLVPVACAGIVRADADGEWPAWFMRLKPDLPKSGGRPLTAQFAYTWSDANADGQLQDAEFRITTAPAVANLAHGHIDANWNVTMPAAVKSGAADQPVGFVLKNLAPTGDKAPQWDWSQAKPTTEKLPNELCAAGSTVIVALHRDETGALALLVRGQTNPGDDRQGEAWPGNNVGTTRIVRFAPDGRWQWSVGKHGVVNDIAPGEFQYPKRIMGTGHGCVFIQDRAVRPGQAWTTDGLYAGSFLDRHVADGFPVESVYRAALAARGPEMFLFDHIGGSVVTTTAGDILWNPVGRNSAPLYRINGWDNWERQSGRITLAAPAAAARGDGSGLRGSYFANPQWDGTPVLVRSDAQVWFGNRTVSFSRDTSGRAWQRKGEKAAFDPKSFSARWEGRIEARFGEACRMIVEYDEGSTASLWLDGQVVVESRPAKLSERERPAGRAPQVGTRTARLTSKPIPMTAGGKHDIKAQYASAGNATPHFHLEWESFTQERQHVPASALSTP